MTPSFHSFRRLRRAGGFTLLEVLLAVVIAVGLFVVALALHQQSAQLRQELLKESERISVLRLVLDKMTMELRSARADEFQGFTGSSNSIQFVSLGQIPIGAVVSSNTLPASDLRVLTYGLISSVAGTNLAVRGISRREDPRVSYSSAPVISTNLSLMDPPLTESVTNLVMNPAEEPFTGLVKRLEFRFWDGAGWVDSWSDTVPPKGIEITLASEASGIEDTEAELFRRVGFIPAGGGKVVETPPGGLLLP